MFLRQTTALGEVRSGLEGYQDSIIVSLIVVVASILVFLVVRYFLKRIAKSLNLPRSQLKGINSIIKLVLIIIAITAIIFQFSQVSGIAASAISVAAGTVIGFSSRNTISNVIAGILLLSSRPFKIGDRIRTLEEDESLIGDVIEITIIYTKIKTIRNELVTIPNQTLLENQIINYSGLKFLATTVEVSIGYDANKDKVKSLLLEAARSTDGIIADPAPYVLITRFDSFAAVYELRAYTDDPNEFLKIQSNVRENVYETFQNAGIDLTTPNILEYINDTKQQTNASRSSKDIVREPNEDMNRRAFEENR
ncbi:MAG: mechanosensitive ion channel family protein [Thermoproteota archaeon]|nr:mechanosensitive ion channel family protein [Thermoproteota archaeon]